MAYSDTEHPWFYQHQSSLSWKVHKERLHRLIRGTRQSKAGKWKNLQRWRTQVHRWMWFRYFYFKLQPSVAVVLLSYRVITGTSFLFPSVLISKSPSETSALVISKNQRKSCCFDNIWAQVNLYFISTICVTYKKKKSWPFK